MKSQCEEDATPPHLLLSFSVALSLLLSFSFSLHGCPFVFLLSCFLSQFVPPHIRVGAFVFFSASSPNHRILYACLVTRAISGLESCVRRGVVHASVLCPCRQRVGRGEATINRRVQAS